MKNKILKIFLSNKKNKKIRLKSINKKRKNKIVVYKRLSSNINLKNIDFKNKDHKYIKPLKNNSIYKYKKIENIKEKNKNLFIINNYNSYESSKSYNSISLSVFENIKNPEERRDYIENYENQF